MELINSEIQETRNLIQDKKFTYAESRASVLLNKQPGNPKIYELLGDIYFNQNFYKKSIWYYLDASTRDQNNKDVLYKLGENIYYLKYYELTEALMKNIIEKDPLYTQAYITWRCRRPAVAGFEDDQLAGDQPYRPSVYR